MKILKLLGHFRWFVLKLAIPVLLAKWRYWRSLRRVRSKVATGEKLRVVFVVGQTSKWKCQSVYDRMRKSPCYDPIIALTICDVDTHLTSQQKHEAIVRNEIFFATRGMRTARCYSVEQNTNETLLKLDPDIVFYSQPWDVAPCQHPVQTAKRALTFYVPYFVPTFESVDFICNSPFQRSMFCFIALNQHVVEAYRRAVGHLLNCHYKALGHPALDLFRISEENNFADGYVIYAPHWSFDHPKNLNSENLSTFLAMGEWMLSYARSHRELKWLFKPHPALRQCLISSGVWSMDQISAYYSAWENLGTVCYDGDYPKYFMRSQALITDCGSFLSEYGCTGKPVIHLISPTRKIHREGGAADAYDSYYQARDCSELAHLMQEVIVERHDPKKEDRRRAIADAGLCGNDASQNILDYLSMLLGVPNDRASL